MQEKILKRLHELDGSYINLECELPNGVVQKLLDDSKKNFITTIKPLYSDIKVSLKIVSLEVVKGLVVFKSPHYIIVSSENKKGNFVNVGFMLQQLDLYLSSIGLGSCWVGMATFSDLPDNDMDFVIAMAFGKPFGSPYREPSEFKRKSLDKVSNTSDERLEVARFAPSARNMQNYYFVTDGSKIRVYCKIAGFVAKKTFTKLHEIDAGIALAHLYVANSDNFRFFDEENAEELSGHYYIGSVEMLI